MKIGILTMPLASNYGGTLQNYALQIVLRRLGYDSVTLRFPSMYQDRTRISSIKLYLNLLSRFLIKKMLRRKTTQPLTPSAWKRNTQNFERFIQNNIVTTEYISKLTVEQCNNLGIKAIIVGSDQIWRPEVPGVVDRYFCGFAKNSNIKRMSYAASLALEKWMFSKEQTGEIRELLKQFSYISVREKNGIELLNNNVQCEAKWVLDPTMLLSKVDYLNLIESIPRHTDNYIFVYILNPNDEKTQLIKKIAQEKGLKIISLNDKAHDPTASIEGWLSYFRDAEYVVTDSFHGTVFSILFEKQFMCFENPHRGNARFESLKLLTGLNDRFVSQCSSMVANEINYSSVNHKIDYMRDSSISYLKNSLKTI